MMARTQKIGTDTGAATTVVRVVSSGERPRSPRSKRPRASATDGDAVRTKPSTSHRIDILLRVNAEEEVNQDVAVGGFPTTMSNELSGWRAFASSSGRSSGNSMDVGGAIPAMRFAREKVVTAAIDHVNFLAPIDLGEVASVEAYVFAVGQTSVDVRVEVDAEDPVSGEVRETTTSFLTFVALDDDGAPTPVPALACPTNAERERRDEARAERTAQAEALLTRMEEDRPAGS